MSDVHIFISWSLPSSQKTARKTHEFFRKLFPTFSFFISSEDIRSGQRWYDVVSERLDACNVGIIVVTQENYLRPWIHYEAGALAKVVSKARVMPLLCGVTNGTIADTPLSAFQAADLSKAGILRIADSIRELTGYAQAEADFNEHFESLWDRYGVALSEVEAIKTEAKPKAPPTKPMVESEVSARLDQLTEIIRSIETRLSPKPISEGDVSKIVANALSSTEPPSDDLVRLYLEALENRMPPKGAAPSNLRLARARWNALAPEGGNPGRTGLLGTVPNPDSETK